MVDKNLDGLVKKYYVDGRLKSSGEYLNGKKNGFWYEYDNMGNEISKGNYKNNKKTVLAKILKRSPMCRACAL